MKFLKPLAFFLTIYGLGLLVGWGFLKLAQPAQGRTFIWGVNMGAFGLNNLADPYQPDNVDRQIELLKQLGVKAVRLNLEIDKNLPSPSPRDQVNDDVINRLYQAGLKILLIVEDPFQDFFRFANQQNGWAWGYRIASRYQGKVYAYQLANEVSGMVIKPNHSGRTMTDYDRQKYQSLKNWLTGLATGIGDADPGVRRVVTAHWVATAIIDQLITDGVPFEVVGWNWFSDMGNDPLNKTFEDGTIINLPEHFGSTGKEFWFTELNRSHGSVGNSGESQQADYLKLAIDNIKQSARVGGIFVYTLADEPLAPKIDDRHWGLVTVNQNTAGRLVFGDLKLAFIKYQAIISQTQDR